MTVKNKSDEIVVTKVGGSNFVKYKPIISLDQRFVAEFHNQIFIFY